jgi:hypothetical protein
VFLARALRYIGAATDDGAWKMASNRRRDPYKNFNFRVLFGAAAMGGLAAAIGGSMLAIFKRGKVGHLKEVRTGARPIEAVGTSTSGFVGIAPKHKKRRASKPARAATRGK